MDVLKGRVARELAALEERIEEVFERALGSGVRIPGHADRFRPAIDIYESDEALVVKVNLAGARSEDVRLIVDGEYLQVTGYLRARYESPPRRHLQMEIPSGHFERVLRMPGRFDPDAVSASLDAGILTIRLPRSTGGARSISVRSE